MKILTHEGLQYFYNQIAAKFSTKEQTAEAIEEAVGNAGVGTVTSVNGKTGVVQLSASDVGALPASTQIPSIAGLATETYVDNKVASMVDSAPETLNTLNELAAALGDDPNFATTVATEIGGKVNKSGDTMTGQLTASGLSIKSDGWAMLRFYNTEGAETGGFYSNQDARQLNFFSKDKSGHNDYFKLPYPSELTADGYYDILTSKNPVTVAQGGTGATDAATARTNLGITPANIGALPISGGTLTGSLTMGTNALFTTGHMHIGSNTGPYLYTGGTNFVVRYGNSSNYHYANFTEGGSIEIDGTAVSLTGHTHTPVDIGAFGALGNASNYDSDLNNFTQQGAILISGEVANRPEGTSVYGICWNVFGQAGSYLEQHYVNAATLKRYIRFKIDNAWRAWAEEYDSNFKPTPAEIGAVSKTGDTMTGDLIATTMYAKSNYPTHGYMNADGTPVVLMQVDANNNRLGIHQKRGGASVWESNEAYMLPAPNLDQTATVAYDILTSKNPVTIAQGGTGATDRKNAFQGLAYLGDEPIKTVNTDTTSEWGEIGTGYTFYMNNLLNNQPSQYGILINYVRHSEIFQIWNTQMGGPTYFRSGNASGWADNGWRKVFDSANYPNGIKYGNAGLDVGIASTPIITAKNNDIANWALERHDANDELTVHFYNNNGTWTSLGRVLATNNFATYVTPSAIGAAPASHTHHNLIAELGNAGELFWHDDFLLSSATRTVPSLHFGTELLYRHNSSTSQYYSIYDTGNKPTASEIGALPVDGKAVAANYADTAANSNWLVHHSSSDFAPTFGANGLQYFNASLPNSGSASTSYAPTADWWHILRMNHPNASGYYVDIGASFHEDRIALRRVASGTDYGWVNILTAKGGSITGNLSVSGTITATKVIGAVYA